MSRAAIQDGAGVWNDAALNIEKGHFFALLEERQITCFASVTDNSGAFVVMDEVAQEAGVLHVPLPAFFTPAQIDHALVACGAQYLIVEGLPEHSRRPGRAVRSLTICHRPLQVLALPVRSIERPPGTFRVSFTSGSTGQPKGVCLSREGVMGTAHALVAATEAIGLRRHLSALPFSVLLENVAGLIAPRLRGDVECVMPPLAELGLTGSSSLDVARMDASIRQYQPDSLILLPQMLRAWCAWLRAYDKRAPDSLKFVAVGGATVGERLVASAHGLGIPAYEGYGLTEAGSVLTLNLPGQSEPGSVGRVLPHAQLRVSPQGEVEIQSPGFLGYAGMSRDPSSWWPTGDLGSIDEGGFVRLTGRRSNLLITGFGRNVSPEWVETALRDQPAIDEAVVFGEGEPTLWAVVWSSATPEAISAAIRQANHELPDYARIGHWCPAVAPFSMQSGLATANGRPRRDRILDQHRDRALLRVGDRVALHINKSSFSFISND